MTTARRLPSWLKAKMPGTKNYIEVNNAYQGFCDLAMGSVYLKEGNIEELLEGPPVKPVFRNP